MTLRFRVALLAAFGLGMMVAGCQEQLTAPGSCPATCPGGTPSIHDTILDAIPNGDQTYTGYVIRGAAAGGLRLSNNYHANTDYGIIRFSPRDSTILADSTQHTYSIDSVAITVTLLARDTSVSGVVLELHRAPVTIDSGSTYADVAPLIVPGTLIDSITIADTIRAGHAYRFLFTGSALAQVAIPSGDSILVLVAAISGASPSGVRIGGVGSTGTPEFDTWINVNTTDTTASVKHQLLRRLPQQTRFVSAVDPVIDPNLLTVGTALGARVVLHFPFPAYLKDSALITRATLELTPADTIRGLVSDSAKLDAQGVVADFGAKSLIANLAGFSNLTFDSADTLRIEVGTEMKHWQRLTLPHPPVLVLQLNPEGASFTEPRFFSTRSPSGRPRLHVTYQLPFAFERP